MSSKEERKKKANELIDALGAYLMLLSDAWGAEFSTQDVQDLRRLTSKVYGRTRDVLEAAQAAKKVYPEPHPDRFKKKFHPHKPKKRNNLRK